MTYALSGWDGGLGVPSAGSVCVCVVGWHGESAFLAWAWEVRWGQAGNGHDNNDSHHSDHLHHHHPERGRHSKVAQPRSSSFFLSKEGQVCWGL